MISKYFYNLLISLILLANTLLFGQFNISGSSSINYGNSQNNYDFTENLIDLNGNWNDWTGWLQFEHSQPPQLGRNYSGLRKFRIEYTKDDYTIKLGDVYEFWGNGLTLNMIDDQSIDLDNGIRGGLIKWSKDIYSFEGLFGNQNIWRISNQVLGFNDRIPNYDIDNTIYGLRGSAFIDEWSTGFHYLNVVETHPTAIPKSYRSINHTLLGFNLDYFSDKLDLSLEFVNKTWNEKSNQKAHENMKDKVNNGIGLYTNTNIYLGSWSIGISYKNYLIEEFSPEQRWDFVNYVGGALPLQQMPTVFKQHSSILLNKITHLIDYNDELGFNLRIEGPITEKIIASLFYSKSSRHNEWILDDQWAWGAKSEYILFPSDDKMYNPFEELFFEINGYTISNKLNYVIGISTTYDVPDLYTNQYINGNHTFSYELVDAFTIPTQFTYIFNNQFSLDFVIEYQEMRKGVESSNYTTIFNSNFAKSKQFNRFIGIGLGKSPKWSVTLNIDYSNTDEYVVIENGRDKNFIEESLNSLWDTSFTWANFGMMYNINQNHQLSLTYGSMRGGVLCSNGVCRYVQPFENGFKIGIVSTF